MVNQKLETIVEFLFFMVKTHTVLTQLTPVEPVEPVDPVEIRHFLHDIPMCWWFFYCQFSYFHSLEKTIY